MRRSDHVQVRDIPRSGDGPSLATTSTADYLQCLGTALATQSRLVTAKLLGRLLLPGHNVSC
jgi:hypothetical protein